MFQVEPYFSRLDTVSKISLVLLFLFCVRAGAEAEGEDPNMAMKDGSGICADCGQTPGGDSDSLVNSQLVGVKADAKSIKDAIDATRIKLPKGAADLSPEELENIKNKERLDQSLKKDDSAPTRDKRDSSYDASKLKGGIPVGDDTRVKIRRKGISVEKKGTF